MKKTTAIQDRLANDPTHKIVGENIVEHIKHVQNVQDAALNHFRYRSKLVRAIQEHVVKDSDCVLIDKEGRNVSVCTGLGYSASVKDVAAPYAQRGECQMLRLTFEVGFRPLEDDPQYNGFDGGFDITKRMDVHVPADLELHFNKEKFNLWLSTMREKRDKEVNGNNLAKLQELMLKYPAKALEIARKMKRRG